MGCVDVGGENPCGKGGWYRQCPLRVGMGGGGNSSAGTVVVWLVL